MKEEKNQSQMTKRESLEKMFDYETKIHGFSQLSKTTRSASAFGF